MSLLGELTYALIRPGNHQIGTIFADITISESHRDEVAITRHPVELGALITDHSYVLPAELEVKCGFSDSTAGAEGYIQAQYQLLLDLKNKRVPFTVYTAKRRYKNMLVRGISTVTDQKNNSVLVASVDLQEIIIVKTQTTGGSSTNSAGSEKGTGTETTTASSSSVSQATPASTADIVNRGDQAGVGVGSQSFAGAFSPGISVTGGNINNQNFGDIQSTLSGLSASAQLNASVGEMTLGDGTVVNPGDGTPVPPNIFGKTN
jgi:hypothetical protein